MSEHDLNLRLEKLEILKSLTTDAKQGISCYHDAGYISNLYNCHEPEYLQFITTILTFILDLSNIFLQIIFSYPFCTAFYGLIIFRTITHTVTQPYSHCT